MGSQTSCQKCNFEDIQYSLKEKNVMLINTLPGDKQDLLIIGTTPISNEERTINSLLGKQLNKKIIIYGKNSNDETIYKKYNQLKDLGFTNMYLYVGGLFEWMLLQDIYGADEFQTTKNDLDILQFKPKSMFQMNLLQDMD